jgi:ferredoxin-NADP reductase
LAQKITGTLVQFERLGDRYAVLQIKPNSNSWKHNPGQYTEIGFSEGEKPLNKIYSIASAVRDDGVLDFCIQLNDVDLLEASKTWVLAKTEFKLAPAAGNFHVPPYQRPVVLLAGGSGITPLKAILEDRVYNGGKDLAQTVLLFGCSDDEEIPFHEELRRLAASRPAQVIVRFFAEKKIAKDDKRAEAGRPMAVLDTYVSPDSDYLMCGPPPFLNATRAHLIQAGIPAEQIHQDRY